MIKKRHFARTLHLGIGVHSFGSATMLVAKQNKLTLEIFDHGVLCESLEFKRKAFIPWSNIKAVEIDYISDYLKGDPDAIIDAPLPPVRKTAMVSRK